MKKKIAKRKKPLLKKIIRTPRRSRAQYKSQTAYYSLGVMSLMTGLMWVADQGFRTQEISVTTDRIIEIKPVALSTLQNKPTQSNLGLSKHLEAQSVEQPKVVADTGPLSMEFKEVQGMDFSERMNFWSHYLETNKVGRKKIESLAAGHPIEDTSPIFPSKFNCTTFVETVAALAQSENSESVVKNLIALRYQEGRTDYVHRNHFAEIDWIPNNQKAKLLSDITKSVAERAGIDTQVESKRINRGQWLQAQMKQKFVFRSLASVMDEDVTRTRNASIDYIEVDQIKNILKEIPNGAVLNLVHKSDKKHPVIISHQGIIIRKGNEVYLRHASMNGYIRTNELNSYLGQLLRHQNSHSKWPLLGVNFNQINASASTINRLSDSM